MKLLIYKLSIFFLMNTYAETIFNSKDLEGWQGNPDIWYVEDGAITAEIAAGKKLKQNEFLFYKEKTANFELTLDYKILAGKTNSGIQIRSARDKHGHAAGYQADLDDGTTWLGRIYDEHGRGLILERGTLTTIGRSGKRDVFPFRNKKDFRKVPVRGGWNRYKITARGNRIELQINDVHFSTLEDLQQGKADLEGLIALQLHSGTGPAKIQFKNIDLIKLPDTKERRTQMVASNDIIPAEVPNIGFEKGDLSGWTVKGAAFEKQPAAKGCIIARGRERSNADGRYFLGGYEVHLSDNATGSITSDAFKVTHQWASLKVGGGHHKHTRVEVVEKITDKVIAKFSGKDSETMTARILDLSDFINKHIFIRIIDNQKGHWGHINYDGFKFHREKPGIKAVPGAGPRPSPVLRNLVSNPGKDAGDSPINNMYVPEGFKVEQVVSKNSVTQPIAFTFDSKGRIWVAEAHAYPRKKKEGEGKDRLVIFEDNDGDGKYETKKIFADDLNLVSGFEIGYGGVYVGASPKFLFIPDRNGDDIPDGEYKILLDGFDLRDTHETQNSFMWGHDGWLYGNHGVFNNSYVGKPGTPKDKRILLRAGVWRFHPVTHKFEVYAKGGSNQWGLDYNADGVMFMTHCRSAWGNGPISQVIRDGHYWTQNNSGHSEFILTPKGKWRAVDGALNNTLLSAAAYGHGKGGAGNDASRSIFGGHSHVGTMIYLGNNWPAEYRNQLYTHNLHGAQLNREFVHKYDSGFLAHSYGRDPLYVNHRQYLAVDLKYGPDGAVYSIDWQDNQHCHTGNVTAWDRSNGAVYRMQWQKTYKPVQIRDLKSLSDLELAGLLDHENEWYSRMSQHILRQRSANGNIEREAVKAIEAKVLKTNNRNRFRALIALYGINGISRNLYRELLTDENDLIRSQAVHFITEKSKDFSRRFSSKFISMAKLDSSAAVRLKLAGACQKRLDDNTALEIVKILSAKVEDANDRFIPKMLWFAYHRFAKTDFSSALKLADESPMAEFKKSVYWYASKHNRQLFFTVVEKVKSDENFAQYMEVLAQTLDVHKKLQTPKNWQAIYKRALSVIKDKNALKTLSVVYGGEKVIIDEKKEKIKRGQQAFAICAACHLPGKNLPGPSLEEVASVYDNKADIIKWIINPGKKRRQYPQMPPFDKMSRESLEDIAAYLLDVRSKSLSFTKVVLNTEYYSEGANFGDFNKDGKIDVVSGPYWYEAPAFTKKHEIYTVKAFSKTKGYANSFFSFTYDFNGDGWQDILAWGLPGRAAAVYINPQNKKGHWQAHQVFSSVGHESPVFADIDKDGIPELICTFKGQVGFAKWDKSKPLAKWQWTGIGNGKFAHGLGYGDINDDGKQDIIGPRGWWQQPSQNASKWQFHPADFGPGGAQMYAYDVDGDGDSDVVTSLIAHGYGLAWYEQIKKDGKSTFKMHLIMGSKPEENKHGMCFSQLHAVELKDINGDGLKDIVTGKCYFAHNGRDSGARDPAMMVYFELSRKDGRVNFIPRVIDRDSGLGRLISVKDINGDKKPDVVSGNKKGVFLFLQK